MISDTARWPVGPVRLSWLDDNSAGLPVTGAHGFCFTEGAILLCDIDGRGLTIPGGHIEPGESIEDCLRREAHEEACVDLGRTMLLGYIEADHSGNSAYDGPYPERSVQAIFRAEIDVVNEFTPRFEAGRRVVVPVAEVPALHHEWNAVLQAALDSAIAAGS